MEAELLPTPCAIWSQQPASAQQLQFVEQARRQLRSILSGDDPRLILIVGPCSIHDTTAAFEYATKLQRLAREVAPFFFVVMRIYFEKARTVHGWKGLLYDPFLDGSHDIATGISRTRQLLLGLIDMQLPAASELLDPAAALYFQDLIAWGCIGARTVHSQIHRQLASYLPMPVAFKNSTEGNIKAAINGILAAALPHTYIGINVEGMVAAISSAGNPDGHIVLRGGGEGPNYYPDRVAHALAALSRAGVAQRLLIDCAHGNAGHCHKRQKQAFRSAIEQVVAGNNKIKGVLLESHLYAGNQAIGDSAALRYAVSITDPCMDWQSTEQLILWAAELFASPRSFIAATG